MPEQPRKNRIARHPFWQADKPYLHHQNISDVRFRLLGYVMAFLAGGINAGGFFAVAAYTSHVTGALSHAADGAFEGEWLAAWTALAGVVCFVLGAAHANWTVLWAKRQRFRSGYGLSMWLEAVYLLLFGLLGAAMAEIDAAVRLTLLFLCFIMGMHNTVMTVLSGGAIRSTHMTGTATDLGIELSKVLYYSRKHHPRLPDVRVNRPKMKLFLGLMAAFVAGGVVGAWGYRQIGYRFTLPMSALLFVFGAGSVGYDVRIRIKWLLQRRRH
ncbi:YoaK family protein [Conchiformibius kuhniae]|uniref:YoaK family protein n=1 Tax=Conchiformibius kuhniae TaxID=211502 RepID=A0A8T9MZP5_9NEIS|nr:YoaK family protein [Conchiformibius kuhniae]UOP05672.1 DUF1275 domain-containing protein [Conchiformibius kuhniae]